MNRDPSTENPYIGIRVVITIICSMPKYIGTELS